MAFTQALDDTLADKPNNNTCKRWERLRDAIYSTAISAFGKKQKGSVDWFEAHSEEMIPVIEEKRSALKAYIDNPCDQNLQSLRTARNRAQKTARNCANEYWLQLCSQIQIASDSGNIKGMYDGIKKAIGPTKKKVAPLKSASGVVIEDREKQMDRWVEHYSELYNRENMVTMEALNSVEQLPVMLELDKEPTMEELNEALKKLSSGKAPGKDGIPAEVLKCSTSTSLQSELHELRRMRWIGHMIRMDDGRIPKDILYGELIEGKRPIGRPKLRFKDICKRDLKSLRIDLDKWESIAADRTRWKHSVNEAISHFETSLRQQRDEKRLQRKHRSKITQPSSSNFICPKCHKDCHAFIGLTSHTKHCF
ncbi:hypothetical protein AC249_AIPGENE16751 [Exaiptasia diaphana]|nr:hypothetical protein AC249_AIPGENE16751 [Exaiptasia diaphana]